MSGKDERRGLRSLGRVITQITDPAVRKRGFVHTEIISRWATIVGDELSRASAPQRISFPTRQGDPGVLHVRVDGARAIELQHMSPLVIERINTYFGYRAIGSVRLIQGQMPIPPQSTARPPEPTEPEPTEKVEIAGASDQIAGTRDPELRAALEALGKRLHGTNPTPSTED